MKEHCGNSRAFDFDQALLADPHTHYAQLRRAGSVHRTTTPDGAPVWLVTGYADVRTALADRRLPLNKRNARSTGRHGPSMPPELDGHLLNLDPPDHTRLRGLVSKALTPRLVDRLRRTIQTRVDEYLTTLTEPPADLMRSLASPLSLAIICELLGIPIEIPPTGMLRGLRVVTFYGLAARTVVSLPALGPAETKGQS